jgi:uncharacterized phage protein (TIGR01671 family)
MTREIKFRARHIKNKFWLENFQISDCGNYIYECGETYNRDEVELVQFTGLKDKNGKEIYEGDLIKKDHHQEIFEVIFCLKGHFAGSFCLKNRETGSFTGFSQESIWMPSDAPKNFDEVIGNIYESELLKDK